MAAALAVLGRSLLLAGAAGDTAWRRAVVRDVRADRAVVQGRRPGIEVDAAAGGIYRGSGTVTLQDSAVSGNVPDNCAPPGSVTGCTG